MAYAPPDDGQTAELRDVWVSPGREFGFTGRTIITNEGEPKPDTGALWLRATVSIEWQGDLSD